MQEKQALEDHTGLLQFAECYIIFPLWIQPQNTAAKLFLESRKSFEAAFFNTLVAVLYSITS